MTNRKLKDEFVSDNLFNKTTDTLEDITASDNFEKISAADSSTNESHVLIKSPDGLANLLTVTPTVTQVAAPAAPKIIEVDLSSRVDNLETGDVFIVMLQLQVSGPVNAISYVADAADTLTDTYTGLITDATNKGFTARYSFATNGTALEITGLFNFDNYDVEDARVERNVDHYWGFQPFFPEGDILVADCDFYSGAVTEQVTGGTNFDVIIDWPFDPNRTPNQFLGHFFRVIIDGVGVASYEVVSGDIADTLEETLDNIRTQVKGQVDASSGGITDFDSCFLDTTTAHNRLVVRRTNTTAWSGNLASRTWDEAPKGLSFALKSLGLEDPTDPTQGLVDATDGLSVGSFTASDILGASNSADKAFDNDASTWWRPGTDIDAVAAEWLKVDFGAGNEKVIERATIQPRFVAGQATVRNFLIQGSNVASPNTGRTHADWTTLGTFTHGNNGNIEQFFFLDNTTAYRHYRIYVDNTYYEYLSIIVVEVQLFEPTSSSTASAAIASGVVQDTTYENFSPVTLTASQIVYGSQNAGWSGSEGDGSYFVAPFDGQMKAVVTSSGAQPSGSVAVFTPRINSVNSAATLTFTDYDDGQFTRETVPVEVSQGDLISLQASETGAVGSTTFHPSITFERTNTRNTNVSSESYIRVTPGASDNLFGSQSGAWTGSLGSGSGFLAPFDGNMKIVVTSSAAIGTGAAVTFTPLVNGSTQANTLLFDQTDTEGVTKVSSEVSVSQGDLLQLNLLESGAANPSATFYVSVVCEASTALEIDSVVESMISETPSANETLYSSQVGGWTGSATNYEIAPFSGSMRILVRNSNAIAASSVNNFTPIINDTDQSNSLVFDQTDSSAVAKLSDKVRVQKGDLVNIRLNEVGGVGPGASFNCAVLFERNLEPVAYFADLEDAQFSLPDGTGTNGQVLTSDGAGGSSWAAGGGSSKSLIPFAPVTSSLPVSGNSDTVVKWFKSMTGGAGTYYGSQLYPGPTTSEDIGSYIVAPFDGELRIFAMNLGTLPTANLTITPRVNLSDQANTLFYDSDAANTFKTSSAVSVSQGDLVSVKYVIAGLGISTDIIWGIQFERTADVSRDTASETFTFISGGTSTEVYSNHGVAWTSTAPEAQRGYFAAPFDGVAKLVVTVDGAITASHTSEVVPAVDDVDQTAAKVQFSDAITGFFTTEGDTFTVSKGDRISAKFSPASGTPGSNIHVAVVFIDEGSLFNTTNISLTAHDIVDATTPRFALQGASAWGPSYTPEGSGFLAHKTGTAKLQVKLQETFTGGTVNVVVRNGGTQITGAGQTIVFSSGATAGTFFEGDTFPVTQGDRLNVAYTITGLTGSCQVQFALVYVEDLTDGVWHGTLGSSNSNIAPSTGNIVVSEAGSLTKLEAYVHSAPGTNDIDLEIYKNGVATGQILNVGTGASGALALTTSVSFAAGDLLSIVAHHDSASGTPVSPEISITVTYEAS